MKEKSGKITNRQDLSDSINQVKLMHQLHDGACALASDCISGCACVVWQICTIHNGTPTHLRIQSQYFSLSIQQSNKKKCKKKQNHKTTTIRVRIEGIQSEIWFLKREEKRFIPLITLYVEMLCFLFLAIPNIARYILRCVYSLFVFGRVRHHSIKFDFEFIWCLLAIDVKT